jgi:hypothetical protein
MAKGRKTGGGSRKGIPNKSPLKSREALWTYIHQQQALGHTANPYEMLVHLMITSQDEHIKVNCAKELAMYLLPKLTALKLSGDAEEPVRTVYTVQLWDVGKPRRR